MSSPTTLLAHPPEELAKLGPGSELDRLVHTLVFKNVINGKKKIPKYSEDAKLILPAMGHLPLGMGRALPGDGFYSEDRPYWAGQLGYDTIFTSNSVALAACKAAVYIAQVLERSAQEPTSSNGPE